MSHLASDHVQTLPPRVAQAATAKDLGAHQRTFLPTRFVGLIIGYSIATALALLGFAAIALNPGNATPAGHLTVVIVFGIIFAIMALVLTSVLLNSPVTSTRARSRKFYVFDDGYVQVTNAGPVAHRWDEVMTVHEELVRNHGGVIRIYKLKFRDGSTSRLTNTSTDLATFGPLLMHHVACAQLPGARSAVRAGQVINFGTIAVNQHGLSYNGKDAMPWSSIKTIQVMNGYVNFDQDGKWLLASVRASKVPNIATFLMLVEELAGITPKSLG